jgi:hypothetical protein
MKKPDELTRKRVENWIAVGEVLEKERREKLRNGNIAFEIRALNSAFKSALRNSTPTTTSGLVEFQRLIKNLR